MRAKVLSRRATLAGLAAAPAAGLAATAPETDPIFAAIERHREAMKALSNAFDARNLREEESRLAVALTDSDFNEEERRFPVTKPAALVEAEQREQALSDLENDARADLLVTVPRTLSGTLAVIRYVTSYQYGESGIHEGRYNLFYDVDEDPFTFLTSIGDAIDAIAGR